MRKRFVSALLALAFVLSVAFISASADIEKEHESLVLSEELQKRLESAKVNELIPVVIWTKEVDLEEIEAIVLNKVGLNRQMIAEIDKTMADSEAFSEEIDRYIATERQIYAERQGCINKKILEKAIVSKKDSCRNSFVSQYAPMVITELYAEEIAALNEMDDVSLVEETGSLGQIMTAADPVTPSDDIAYPMNTLFEAQGIVRLRDRTTSNIERRYRGSGIKIGLLGQNAPNSTLSVFQGASLQGDLATTGTEGSECACMLVSQESGALGICPGATLYCQTITGVLSEYYNAIENCLNNGVNVICQTESFPDISSSAKLTMKKWVEHIAINHSVHFVACAGEYLQNYASNLVQGAAAAYNTITVGNVPLSLLTSIDTCFNQPASAADKPDISAIGTAILLPSSCFSSAYTGTKFAAATVAGIIAQLLDYRPGLKTKQDQMKACLLAGISNEGLQFDTMSSSQNGTISSYHIYGAGLVNAYSAYFIMKRGTVYGSSFDAQVPTWETYPLNVGSSDDKVRIALTWLKPAKVTSTLHTGSPVVSDPQIANLNLVILDPNGNEIFSSTNTYGNVELIQFDVNGNSLYGPGTYTVIVRYDAPIDNRTNYGVAWW